MDSSDDEIPQTSALEDKVHQMSLEIDSLKASRNYYKDQCESLFVSLSNTVQQQTPAYRTQQEVENIIANIKAQESEKSKRLKLKFKENERNMREEIDSLNKTIKHHEMVIAKQKNTRATLIEQLMSYKKQLSVTETCLKETEQSLSLKTSQESLLQTSFDNSQLETMEKSYKQQIRKMKKQILKLAKQLDEKTTSMALSQTIQEDAIKENEKFKNMINEQKDQIEKLEQENEGNLQQISDSRAMLANAVKEAQLLEGDVETAHETIEVLVNKLRDNDAKFDSYNQELVNKIVEINQHKTVIQNDNEEIETLREKNAKLTEKLSSIKDEFAANKDENEKEISELENEIRELKETIEKCKAKEQELNKKIQQQNAELIAESRLHQAAEVAKDAAITNFKNAYAMLNTSENTRNEYTAEVEKITAELEKRNAIIEEKDNTIMKLNEENKKKEISLQSTIDEFNKLSIDYKNVSDQYEVFQQHSMLKEDARKQIKKVSDKLENANEEIERLESEKQIAVNELSDIRVAFSHQEETISSLQEGIKSLTKINKKLRSKFMKGEEPEKELLMNPNVYKEPTTEECNKCTEMKNKVSQLERQSEMNEATIKELKQNLETSLETLHQVSESFKDIVAQIPNANQSIIDNCNEIQETMDINEACKLIIDVAVDFFDDVVKIRAEENNNSTTENVLLKSSMMHLNEKVDTLKERNKQQAKEINGLQTNIESAYSNKERCEDELQTLSQTLTSLRVQYEATKGKLAESEKQKKKLKEELTLARIEQRKPPQESSFSDSFDFSDVSSFSEENQPTINKKKGTTIGASSAALGESLAMLDVFCQ